MAYRIDRIIDGGGFHDYLMCLWEGDDLPSFIGSTQRAYLFDDKETADRVAQRLAAKCSETMATPHLPAKPITYEVVEVSKHAWGRYKVFSNDRYKNYPEVGAPAGCYDNLDDAKKHADSVTYKMVVVDSKNESAGFVYCNWEFSTLLTPDNCGCSQIACNIVNNTFLSLDGFEAMRKQMAGTDYTAEHFGAELARIVDREIGLADRGSTPAKLEMSLDKIKAALVAASKSRFDSAFTIHSYRDGEWMMVGSFINPIETAETFHSYLTTGRWGNTLEIRCCGFVVKLRS